jgi:hypothetical protein
MITTHYFTKQVYLDYTKRIGKCIRFDNSEWLVIAADSQGKSPYWKLTLKETNK